MTPAALSELRHSLPDCTLAVWVDMESGTVLAADGDLAFPQEHLDALGDCAALLLGVADPEASAPADAALFESPTGCRAFLRSPAAAGEALCCVCGPDATQGILETLRAALARGLEAEVPA